MPLQTAVIDRILFIRWTATPTESDLAQMDAAMGTLFATPAGEPLFHVSILPHGIEMPERAIQKGIMRRVLKLRSRCTSLYAIYEGTTVRDAIVRRFLKSMVTMMGMKGKAFVEGSVDKAVGAMAGQLSMPAADVVARFNSELSSQPQPANA